MFVYNGSYFIALSAYKRNRLVSKQACIHPPLAEFLLCQYNNKLSETGPFYIDWPIAQVMKSSARRHCLTLYLSVARGIIEHQIMPWDNIWNQ